jgi:MFS family permease
MSSSPYRFSKRNLFLLTCCQAVGQSANTMMFSATALSVVTFMSRRDLANLPLTMQHLGVMLSVFPASMLMQRMGRKFGFRVGSLFGMAGAACCGFGLLTATFWLMCLGGVILGYAVANLQMYRFAAVELAPPEMRAKAIAWVTAGGMISGMIGPMVVRLTFDRWTPLYIGTFGAMIGVHIVVITIMSFITFPAPPKPAAVEQQPREPARPLLEIAAQPKFIGAVVAGMVAYGTMSFLMSASPLAIVGCGLAPTEAQWVIFLHVMGMFAPSFFTGNLIQRFGVTTIMLWGIALLLTGVAIGLSGLDAWNFRLALMFNGIGWNFLFVGATTLVTTTYRPSERGKAQALNDFLIFGTTATASFFAGFLQDHFGWIPLNWFSLILVVTAIPAVVWLRVSARRAAALA